MGDLYPAMPRGRRSSMVRHVASAASREAGGLVCLTTPALWLGPLAGRPVAGGLEVLMRHSGPSLRHVLSYPPTTHSWPGDSKATALSWEALRLVPSQSLAAPRVSILKSVGLHGGLSIRQPADDAANRRVCYSAHEAGHGERPALCTRPEPRLIYHSSLATVE